MVIKNDLWESDVYYKKAGESSSVYEYPGMKVLKTYSSRSKNILDLGCGDGTRLHYISKNENHCAGVDISKYAISIAKKRYPECDFKVANLEKLPFNDNSFDFVYSAFVLEHLQNPEKIIDEAIRVLNVHGILLLMAPNFGAPNRISPPAKYSRMKKLFFGLIKDFVRPFLIDKSLIWRKVKPKKLKNNLDYEIDCDTTIEPYLGDLIEFLKYRKFKIITKSSLWSQEIKIGSFVSKVIKSLANIDLYPFINWGPHLLIVARKK
jgi:ubiquinone/menaquinone biosynthesis C-methylase UbiE